MNLLASAQPMTFHLFATAAHGSTANLFAVLHVTVASLVHGDICNVTAIWRHNPLHLVEATELHVSA